jgi:hypothetical protein
MQRTYQIYLDWRMHFYELPAVITRNRHLSMQFVMSFATNITMLTTELAVAIACAAAWFRERVLAGFGVRLDVIPPRERRWLVRTAITITHAL